MTQALARFAFRGPPHAVLLIVASELLALLFPPVGLIGAAVIALLSLRSGAASGFNALLLGAAALTLIFAAAGMPPAISFAAGVAQWVPVYVLALALRLSRDWTLTLQVGAGIGLLGVLALHLMFPDITESWRQLLKEYLEPVLLQSGKAAEETGPLLESLATRMTGLLWASVLLSSLMALMLGRQMQAALFNPGGFSAEFRELRTGLWPAALGLALIAASLVSDARILDDLLFVLGALYLVQGVAVVYALVVGAGAGRKWSTPAIVLAMLAVVMLLGPMMTLLSGLGLADTFADFRRRFLRRNTD
ncbi:MAG TPA: hypothetical protein ENK26_13555 [Gammaproteobacteria bacterium]|nr:hypothetical protein [Gammaproteobacteria bacterium]